jgi:hypothetical protein
MELADIDPFTASDADLIAWCENARFISGGRCFRGIVQPTPNVVIKIGGDVTAQEATNQQYAYEQLEGTKLRVPRVYRFFQNEKDYVRKGYLMMEYIPGRIMADYSADDHSNDKDGGRYLWAQQIYEASTILSRIRIPEFQKPGPVGGGEPRGYLFSETGFGCMANFESVEDMNTWLNKRLVAAQRPRVQRQLKSYYHEVKGDFNFRHVELVMTHGDLAPRNFIVMDDGQLALLDWAFAGFYPKAFEVFACRVRMGWDPILLQVSELLAGTTEVDELFRLLRCVQVINNKFLPEDLDRYEMLSISPNINAKTDSSLPQQPVEDDTQPRRPIPARSAEQIEKAAIRREKFRLHLEEKKLMGSTI